MALQQRQPPTDADGIANSEGPDQTAPLGARSSLIWVCSVCPDMSVLFGTYNEWLPIPNTVKETLKHVHANLLEPHQDKTCFFRFFRPGTIQITEYG